MLASPTCRCLLHSFTISTSDAIRSSAREMGMEMGMGMEMRMGVGMGMGMEMGMGMGMEMGMGMGMEMGMGMGMGTMEMETGSLCVDVH